MLSWSVSGSAREGEKEHQQKRDSLGDDVEDDGGERSEGRQTTPDVGEDTQDNLLVPRSLEPETQRTHSSCTNELICSEVYTHTHSRTRTHVLEPPPPTHTHTHTHTHVTRAEQRPHLVRKNLHEDCEVAEVSAETRRVRLVLSHRRAAVRTPLRTEEKERARVVQPTWLTRGGQWVVQDLVLGSQTVMTPVLPIQHAKSVLTKLQGPPCPLGTFWVHAVLYFGVVRDYYCEYLVVFQ